MRSTFNNNITIIQYPITKSLLPNSATGVTWIFTPFDCAFLEVYSRGGSLTGGFFYESTRLYRNDFRRHSGSRLCDNAESARRWRDCREGHPFRKGRRPRAQAGYLSPSKGQREADGHD